jgi:hypothetical protein
MPGRWLSWIGQRLLHADTFALMLSPAIADLQFEAPTAVEAVRHRHYQAVLKAFIGALSFDLASDVVTLTSDVRMIAILVVLQASYYSFMLILLSGLGAGTIATFDVRGPAAVHAICYVAAVCVACILTTSVCFWPPRRTFEDRFTD